MGGVSDDKPTIVLDLSKLKEDLKANMESLSESDLEISFGAKEETKPIAKKKVILFDYNSTYFNENKDDFPIEGEYLITKDLKELNTYLQSNKNIIIAFNYSVAGKVYSQLAPQLKKKFPQAKILLFAKNLSEEKALKHQKSSEGAHGYVSIPIQKEKFTEVLEKL